MRDRSGNGEYARPDGNRDSMMLVTPGRIAYLGRIGTHDVRVLGATTIYVAMRNPFAITRRGVTEEARLTIVPAHEVHRVQSEDRYGAQLVLESETIFDPLQTEVLNAKAQGELAETILAGFRNIPDGEMECSVFDRIFFGRTLRPSRLDRRIRSVVESVGADPAAKHSAEFYAQNVGLSVSRFSHLFRGETGSTFRRFCAWKRVRGIMPLVCNEEKLVETALNAGYADSTHFSHSVRQFFGVRPRDLVDIMAARGFRMIANARIDAGQHRLAV